MSNFPIIIQHGEIVFDYSPEKPNEVKTFYDISNWITPYGLLIPLSWESINIKMFMLDGYIDIAPYTVQRSLLLDHHGKFKYIFIRGEDSVTVHYVDINDNTKFVLGDSELEMHVSALFSLDLSTDEIIKNLTNNSELSTKSIFRSPIERLIKIQKEQYPITRPFHSSVLFRNSKDITDINRYIYKEK